MSIRVVPLLLVVGLIAALPQPVQAQDTHLTIGVGATSVVPAGQHDAAGANATGLAPPPPPPVGPGQAHLTKGAGATSLVPQGRHVALGANATGLAPDAPPPPGPGEAHLTKGPAATSPVPAGQHEAAGANATGLAPPPPPPVGPGQAHLTKGAGATSVVPEGRHQKAGANATGLAPQAPPPPGPGETHLTKGPAATSPVPAGQHEAAGANATGLAPPPPPPVGPGEVHLTKGPGATSVVPEERHQRTGPEATGLASDTPPPEGPGAGAGQPETPPPAGPGTPPDEPPTPPTPPDEPPTPPDEPQTPPDGPQTPPDEPQTPPDGPATGTTPDVTPTEVKEADPLPGVQGGGVEVKAQAAGTQVRQPATPTPDDPRDTRDGDDPRDTQLPENVCGPDITAAYVEGLKRVFARFQQLSDAEKGAYDGPWFMNANGTNIDMVARGLDLSDGSDRCPRGTCKKWGNIQPATVTLGGHCIPAHVANDILYGYASYMLEIPWAIAVSGAQYAETASYGAQWEPPTSIASYNVGWNLASAMSAGGGQLTEADIQSQLENTRVSHPKRLAGIFAYGVEEGTLLDWIGRVEGYALQCAPCPEPCTSDLQKDWTKTTWTLSDGTRVEYVP